MEKTYHIIWADDEIDALLDETSKALLSRHNVDVIKCNNAAILDDKLRNVCHRIDAVIVDANFTARGFTPSDETIVSGLRKAMQLIGEYKHIPFYLYTQRVNLPDLVDEGELDYFKDNDAIFFKGNGLPPLLERIKNDVDKINSVEFQIENQFEKELSFCKIFDEQCKANECNANSYKMIKSLLIHSRDGSLCSSENYFNQFRSEVFENMNKVASNFGIVPPNLSLNDFSKFLCRSKESKYKLSREVLPTPLHTMMIYVIRMNQDGSHPDGIRRYVAETSDVLIIRSLLFAVLELISWFTRYLANNTNKEKNSALWQ